MKAITLGTIEPSTIHPHQNAHSSVPWDLLGPYPRRQFEFWEGQVLGWV
jgi:hypothetical protein